MEFLYLVYPVLFKLAISPIDFVFFVLDKVSSLWPGGKLSLFWMPLSTSLFFALGAYFSLVVAVQMFGKYSKTRLNWRILLPGLMALGLTIELLKYRFADYLIVQLLQGSYFLVFYMSMVFLGVGSLFFFVLRALLRKIQGIVAGTGNARVSYLISALIFILGMYPFFALGIVLIEIFLDPIGNPQASRFAVVHAAIKNTCIYDEKQENCPHTLEEISYIEPQAYEEMLRGTQVSYVYYPESNQYTLVVRYAPLRAVVFDQRLVAEHGLDFWEYDVNLLGQDRLKNPPGFNGPWEFEEWGY